MKGELKIDGFYFYCHKYLDDERTSKASKDVLQLTRRILPIKPMSFKKLFQCDCNFEERTYEHYRCLFIRFLHRTSPVASGFRMCQRSVDYRGVESPSSFLLPILNAFGVITKWLRNCCRLPSLFAVLKLTGTHSSFIYVLCLWTTEPWSGLSHN